MQATSRNDSVSIERGSVRRAIFYCVALRDARKGWGRTLVEAAKNQAQKRGYRRISLRTYADVPWNAPFYATAGFVEEEPATQFHRSLVGIETELGLDRYGRRVQMAAHTEEPRP